MPDTDGDRAIIEKSREKIATHLDMGDQDRYVVEDLVLHRPGFRLLRLLNEFLDTRNHGYDCILRCFDRDCDVTHGCGVCGGYE